MEETLHVIKNTKLIAIIRSKSSHHLEQTVERLYNGGIRAVEITLNTPDALDGIKKIKSLYPDLHIGAGTVLDSETARLAILAGAEFILTPTLNMKTIEMGNRYGILVIPGVLTPTEALTACEKGASLVKIFPVQSFGPSYISQLKAPLPQVNIVAVGGINQANAASYLRAGSLALGVGSSIVDEHLVERGEFDLIEQRAKDFVGLVQNWKREDKQGDVL